MSAPVEEAHGTATNVDLREDDEPTPFDLDVDAHRVIGCYCVSCGEQATLLVDPGRTREWEHARRHPRHVVDYWREDEP